MHNPPLTIALFENCRAQATTIDVACLAVLRYIGRDSVFESGPGSLACQMNLDIAKRVRGILHLAHLWPQMIVAVIRPTVVRMAAFKDSQ